MAPERMELPQGTLDLLILRAVALEPQHGWAITLRIHQMSREAVAVGHGSLYPALQRLETRGWIDAEWGTSDNNRRARFYSLTAAGRRELRREEGEWRRIAGAIMRVLGGAPERSEG